VTRVARVPWKPVVSAASAAACVPFPLRAMSCVLHASRHREPICITDL
jgi:hypothetical protein